MTTTFSNAQILHELEPEAERLFNRHMSKFKEWNPHDFIPWSDGKNYYSMGGEDWSPEQPALSWQVRLSGAASQPDVMSVFEFVEDCCALTVRPLTEDDLPAPTPEPAAAPADASARATGSSRVKSQ